jgi:peptide/nickel transport system ATP-binding protein
LYRHANGQEVDLAQVHGKALKPYRREIRMIFQDPYSSLNPRLPVRELVGEPLKVNKIAEGRALERRVASLLERVGLRPEYIGRYPHAFSGGERQRIGIARALALEPRLVVADEAVSALDVSIQAQTLNLLQDLQQEFDLTYIFVAHDLSVVQHICDRVAVMYVGKIVELADNEAVFRNPQHPYTEALLGAVPKPDPRLRPAGKRIRLTGEVADPANPPTGCYFHPRCPYAQDICAHEPPPLRDVGNGHFAACHFAEKLDLHGVVAEGALGRGSGGEANA